MTAGRDRWVARARRVGDWVHRQPIVARHLAAFRRANGMRFTRWAAGMALFGYLALFPLAVLASWAFATALRRLPEVQASAEQSLTQALTVDGLLAPTDSVDLSSLAESAGSAGVIALFGLLFAGTGWIDSTIEGIRRMLGALRRPRPYPVLLLEDLLWLVSLGSLLILALGLTVWVGSFGQWVADQAEVSWLEGSAAGLIANLTSGVLLFLVIVVLFGFAWNRVARSWRAVLPGALLAVVGIAVLSQVAFLLVGRTLNNPVYGALAIAAAMLLLLYFGSMVVLYAACWVAVREGAPEPVEESAYYARVKGGSVKLPAASDERGG